MLKIHNTLTGRKEAFEPLLPGQVGMYVCGVTVYDECHLGHARSALVFEVIRSYLRFRGYAVTYVRNFTDVDDKIIQRASHEGVSWSDIVTRYLAAYVRDMDRLGVAPAEREPRATEHIPDMIEMIQTLMVKGHAYQVDGDVYFDVRSYPAYGRLSKRKPEELLAGARVEIDDRKRSPMDFSLWKTSKAGEPAWSSPWGAGRPGWHIECSAMSIRHLGPTFDIHGGGMDLIFPHHENEIAQSCAATGKEFARYWIHNGFVQVNQEKMSKSLGNFFTIREVFEAWQAEWGYPESVTAETLRYCLLATHYRSPLDFSDQALHEAKRALDGFYGLFQRLEEGSAGTGTADLQLEEELFHFERTFLDSMDDDFNTPAALAQFQTLRGDVNRLVEAGLSATGCRQARETFESFGRILSLFQLKDWQFNPQPKVGAQEAETDRHAPTGSVLTDAEVQAKVAERNEARRRKDFVAADRIRAELALAGVTVEDRPDGTSRWKR